MKVGDFQNKLAFFAFEPKISTLDFGGSHLKDLILQNKYIEPIAVPTREVENTHTYPPVWNKYAPIGAAMGLPKLEAKCNIPYRKAKSFGLLVTSAIKAFIAKVHTPYPPEYGNFNRMRKIV